MGQPAIFRRLLGVVGPAELVGVDRRRSLWNPSALARLDADLVAVEIHPWAAASFRREGWLIAPNAVRWRAAAADVPPECPSKSLKSDLRLIASQGYALEVCQDGEAWREFFCRMVVPLARRRFGSRAIYASRSLVRALAARGDLLFVVEDDVRVAGGCVLTSGAKLWLPFVGVRDGDFGLIQRGAISAVYRFIVERAHESGVRTLDFGRTSPFLDGGVARYKAKWGFAPEREVLARLVALRPDPDHVGLAKAFAAHPFLIDQGDRLAAFPTQP